MRPYSSLVMAVMLAGSAAGRPGFLPVYRSVLLRAGWVRPDPLADHPEPHRFAQTLGGGVLVLASLALLLGAPAWVGAGLAGDLPGSAEPVRRFLRRLLCVLLAGTDRHARFLADAAPRILSRGCVPLEVSRCPSFSSVF